MTRSSWKLWISSDTSRKKQQERGTKDDIRPQTAHESKPKTHTRSHPVSTRAYNKKDYEYLSTFSGVAGFSALRAASCHDKVKLSHERSDGMSDLFTYSSSVDYTSSISSACSTSSSAQSWPRDDTSSTDMESHHEYKSHLHHVHHHGRQQHHESRHNNDHQETRESSALDYSAEVMENLELQGTNKERTNSDSNCVSKAAGFGFPSSTENGSLETNEVPIKLQPKDQSQHVRAGQPAVLPKAVLPKFGSWDISSPSSRDAYTLIFERCGNEKRAQGIPNSALPTLSKAEEIEASFEHGIKAEEEAEAFLGLEIKAKEPLFAKLPSEE